MRKGLFDKDTRWQLISLYLVCGIAEFANYMITIGMVYHLSAKFSLDAFQIGISSSIPTASYLLFCLLAESFYEKMKPAVCVMCSLLGMGLMAAFMTVAPSVTVFNVLLFFYGAFRSMLWPQITGLINRGKEGEALSSAQSGFNLSWSLFSGISPLFSGIVLMFSTSIVFLFSSGLIFVATAFLFASSLTRNAPSDKKEIEIEGMLDHSTNLRFFSWTALVLIYIANNATLTVFPLFAQNQLRLSELEAGVLLSIKGVVASVFFVFLGRMSWWKFRKSIVFLTTVALIGVCAIGRNITSFWTASLFCFSLGVVFSLTYTQALFYAMSGAVNKSKRMMYHEVILTLGCVAGSSGGGYFFRQYGWDELMWKILVITLSVLVVELLVSYYMHRNRVAEEISHFNDKA